MVMLRERAHATGPARPSLQACAHIISVQHGRLPGLVNTGRHATCLCCELLVASLLVGEPTMI